MIAVLFETDALPEQQERYFQLAVELKPLLEEVEGFISIQDGSSPIKKPPDAGG